MPTTGRPQIGRHLWHMSNTPEAAPCVFPQLVDIAAYGLCISAKEPLRRVCTLFFETLFDRLSIFVDIFLATHTLNRLRNPIR